MEAEALIVQANIARVLVLAMGMMTTNLNDLRQGKEPTHSEEKFEAVIHDNDVGYNSMLNAVRSLR